MYIDKLIGIFVTLPPEMSRIASYFIFWVVAFPKGVPYIDFCPFYEIDFSSLFYVRKVHLLVCYTHKKCMCH